MKKLMFVLVLLLIASTCFALESGPSNKVGYVKLTVIPGQTPFGLPFVFWDVPTGNVPTYGVESRRPSDIVGSQAACGGLTSADRVVLQNGGAFAWRNTAAGCTWTGTLETSTTQMDPGRAYWYVNRTGVNRTLLLAGEADTTAAGIPALMIGAPSVPNGANGVPYSWRDPREILRDRLNLLAAGFRGGTVLASDRVVEQSVNARPFYYRTDLTPPAWAGTLPSVSPGMAYWIVNKHYGLAGWNYTYLANGAAISMPNGDPEPMKMDAPAVKPSVKAHTATK